MTMTTKRILGALLLPLFLAAACDERTLDFATLDGGPPSDHSAPRTPDLSTLPDIAGPHVGPCFDPGSTLCNECQVKAQTGSGACVPELLACEHDMGFTGCLAVLQCQSRCRMTDAACLAACVRIGGSGAQALYASLTKCLKIQCP